MEGWWNEVIRPLASVAEVTLGRQRAPQYEQGEHLVPYLRSANIVDGRLDLGDVKRMNFTPAEQKRFALIEGDVLITEGSGSPDTVGASAVWHADIDATVCFQNTLLRLRPRPGISDGRYLAWWARHAHASGLMRAAATGANILHLGAEDLRRLPIQLPPLDVQRRIADFLDDQVGRIDKAGRLREQQAAAAGDLLESVAHAAVTGGSRFSGQRAAEWALPWAEVLPAGWRTPRICQVARMGTGHTPSRERPELWKDAGIPWLTTGDVHRFRRDEIDVIDDTQVHISQLGIENSAAVLHPAGTVALSRTASAGFSILMGGDMATSQDFATWTCGPLLQPLFLLWCLRAMRRDLLGRLAMGSTHKTIYFPDLMSIRIPLPPVADQRDAVKRINDAAEVSRTLQEALKTAVNLVAERKRSLISAAVMGEFDVTSASSRAFEIAVSGTGGSL